jgi:hypothetical protein
MLLLEDLFCILLSIKYLVSGIKVYIMTEYERMGNGGTRVAIIIVNQTAMCFFEEFLQSKNIYFRSDRRTTPSEIWKE